MKEKETSVMRRIVLFAAFLLLSSAAFCQTADAPDAFRLLLKEGRGVCGTAWATAETQVDSFFNEKSPLNS